MARKSSLVGLGLGLGAALGIVVGVLAGHVGAWLVFGVAIGMLIGSQFSRGAIDCPECEASHKMHHATKIES